MLNYDFSTFFFFLKDSGFFIITYMFRILVENWYKDFIKKINNLD